MHQQRENLDFLFRRISPERLLNELRLSSFAIKGKGGYLANKKELLQQWYHHYAPLNMGEYSTDELELRAADLFQDIEMRKQAGVFAPLLSYSESVLRIIDKQPVCRLKEVLNWNSITQRLGQDLFTSCWLAWQDREDEGIPRWSFTWPAIIKTDDKSLNQILKRGLAENHFHLYGSTQVFSVSWACLMNHPSRIAKISKEIQENLSININRGPNDNVMSIGDRLWYAVTIRELLCRRCLGRIDFWDVRKAFIHFDAMRLPTDVYSDIEVLRQYGGAKFSQHDRKRKCLDYANNSAFYYVDEKSANRLLSGERSFLYHCFKMHFKGKFSLLESALLHLYILIKSNFAGELIQNNYLYGFHNFADYQGRKGTSFYGFKEYEEEALRLSVRAQIEDNSLVSLEARIMPPKHVKKEITHLDRVIQAADIYKDTWEHYYVIHFPKSKFEAKEIPQEPYVQVPRNRHVRKNARAAAKRLNQYIQNSEIAMPLLGERQRIYGIDTCSKEIGCGPENFATEFRYLRNCNIYNAELHWWQRLRQKYTTMGVTNHAGEDFLDIVDGLRTIDETLEFMEFERGDRIGHAIALGVDARSFYQLKRYDIYLTKQQYLDNIIWMLYRSLEWQIALESDFRVMLEKKARELFRYIYEDKLNEKAGKDVGLDYYFYSWKLRGDSPDLYSLKGTLPKWMWQRKSYEQYMRNTKDKHLEEYRAMNCVKELVKLYHFDNDVKRRGLQPEQLQIYNWKSYIEVVTQFQNKLQEKIADAGIAVECNLTSNVLIGTFRKYDSHPILRINRHMLGPNYEGTNILASINTDDLGVFATSLGNEYALLLCALQKMTRIDGRYDDIKIYDYLNHLRESGISMTFRESNDLNSTKNHLAKYGGCYGIITKTDAL